MVGRFFVPMPSPLHLSDTQLTELLQLSAPLRPNDRHALFVALAEALAGRTDIGDGELFRAVKEIIRAHRLFDAPLMVPDDEH
jgi:hypothetical protein